MSRKTFVMLGLAVVASAGALLAQGREKKGDAAVRSVEGAVRNSADSVVEGAVVQLKDTKTKQVRSYITKADGTYHFHGLSPNVDYELKADHKGGSSDTKTLSIFDSRPKAIINLKIETK